MCVCVCLTVVCTKGAKIPAEQVYVSFVIVKETPAAPWRKRKGLLTRARECTVGVTRPSTDMDDS